MEKHFTFFPFLPIWNSNAFLLRGKAVIILIFLLFFSLCGYSQNTSFFQAQFNGGVTACGYGPANDAGGTGTITLNIAPGSTIYKAWLFAGRQGVAPAVTVTLNGNALTFNNTNQVSATFQSPFYGGNSAVHAIDVSGIINPAVNTYTLAVPGSQSPTSDRFQDFYLYVAYANNALPQVTGCIFLNSTDMAVSVSDVFAMTYPIGNVSSVGMALYFGYACDAADGEEVSVQGTALGNAYGPNSNSGECAGPYGDFYYQSGALHGLLDGNPNQAINGLDCISNIQALVSNCTTSVSATFTHGNQDNALWGFFFTYVSDSTTATTDTSICNGHSVQLNITASGGTVSWSPTGGLSCTTCTDPVATPAATTTYIATVTGGGCGAVTSDTARIAVTNGTTTVSVDDTTICSGQPATLTATPSSGGGTYLWTPGGAMTQSITVSPASTTSYIVQYTSGTCGSASDTAIVTILNPTSSAFAQSICSGQSYNFHGQLITMAGTYRDTTTNAVGCDSIIVLTASMLPSSATAIAHSMCSGPGYLFNGQNLTATGIYKDTLTNASGCDSVITLTLSVLSASATAVSHTICPGSSYNFHGQNLTAAGTYKDTLTNIAGCDSVITLTLTASSASATAVSHTICNGGSYNFNGQNLTTAGTYKDTLANVSGCDSIITLTLSVSSASATAISHSMCSGTTYTFNGQNLTTAGSYKDTLTNAVGCDSIVTLTLTVLPASATAISHSICSGDSYIFNGQSLSTAGTYKDTLTNAAGCDSVVTLTLAILATSSTTINHSICSGSAYNFNGQTLTATGQYVSILANAVGCDSIVTLNLTANPVSATAISQSICHGAAYNFNGQSLSLAGTYRDTLSNVLGCDSIVTLTLTVLSTSATAISHSICIGTTYTFNGQSLSTAGIYKDTLSNVFGCDSIVTLTLTVLPASATAISHSICSGDSYIFNGQSLSTAGTYKDTLINVAGCDSIVTLTLAILATSSTTINHSICSGSTYNFNGQTLTATGQYVSILTNAVGCDSIVTLNLTANPTSATALTQSICSGTGYNFNGQILTTAGTYRDTLSNVFGCDSIVSLTLTVLPASATGISQNICSGSAYNFNGQTLNTAGIYIDTLANAVGCDSVITLTLTVTAISTTPVSRTICSGSSYIFGGQALTAAGIYSDTLTGAAGCDSIIVLTLHVAALSATSLSQSICSGATITFAGAVISSAGIYTNTLSNIAGCDSIVTLTVTVLDTSLTQVHQSICSGTTIDFNGQAIAASGTYAVTLSNAAGCDSTVVLTVTVLDTSATPLSQTICSGTTVSFAGQTLSSSGVYTHMLNNVAGCDSVITLTLTVIDTSATYLSQSICPGAVIYFNGQAISIAGTYSDTLNNAAGCDSIITLQVQLDPPVDIVTDTVANDNCPGSSDGYIVTDVIGCTGCAYHWSNNADSAAISALPAGSYSVTVTDAAGCSATAAYSITAPPQATLNILPQDSTILSSDSLTLMSKLDPFPASGTVSYSWSPAEGLSCTDCPYPVFSGTGGQYTYSLIINYNNGCLIGDTVTVTVTASHAIYVPNAFTPNGDGINDVFQVFSVPLLYFHLTIFDRWGEKVYDTYDESKGWDGAYRGQQELPGVYTYLVDATFEDGYTVHPKGGLTLIR
jgi:gliding motility-associated-like protein